MGNSWSDRKSKFAKAMIRISRERRGRVSPVVFDDQMQPTQGGVYYDINEMAASGINTPDSDGAIRRFDPTLSNVDNAIIATLGMVVGDVLVFDLHYLGSEKNTRATLCYCRDVKGLAFKISKLGNTGIAVEKIG